MRKIYIALGLTAFCIYSTTVSGNHFNGGELTYNYLGGDSFEVVQSVYRNCVGSSSGNTVIKIQPKNGTAFTVTPTEFTTVDITPVCTQSCTRCGSSSCSLDWGMQKLVYSAIIDLASYSQCEFTISFAMCCRVSGIGTGPADSDFYLECMLDKCKAGPHSSPRWAREALIFACKDQCTRTSMYAFGDEGDSLVYSLTQPLEGPNSPVSFSSGYSYDQPFKVKTGSPVPGNCEGLYYDSHSGEMVFMPTNEEFTTMACKVSQYKKDSAGKYRLVGTSTRESTLGIISCPTGYNKLPIATGINGGLLNSIVACPDVDLLFSIGLFDLDKDNIVFSWDKNIPDAELTRSGNSLYFKWRPDKKQVRKEPYFFWITIHDDKCPFPTPVSKRYDIYVKDSFPSYQYSRTDSGCGKFYFTAKPKDTAKKFMYEWKVNNHTVSTAKEFSRRFSQNGTYIIQGYLLAPIGCGKYISDTVKIIDFPPFSAGEDTGICKGDSIQLMAYGGAGYKWHSDGALSSDTIYNPTVSPTKTTTYYLEGKTNDGCIRIDSVTVTVVNIKDAILSGDTLLCRQPLVSNPLELQGVEIEGASYVWSPTAGISGSYLSSMAKVRPASTTTYRLTTTTKEGCTFKDSVTVYIGSAKADAGKDQVICEGEKVTLQASGGISYEWKADSTLSTLDEAITEAAPTSSRYYYVTVKDTYGCTSADSVHVQVKPFQASLIKLPPAICPGDTLKLGVLGGSSYEWSPNEHIIDSKSATPSVFPVKSTWYYVSITDVSNGCTKLDSVLVAVDTTCVWPGDANRDKRVDYLDILSVGVGFNATGPARSVTSSSWRGLYSGDWSRTTGQGIDYKNIDCNGDGIIGRADTGAIHLNYGNTYGSPVDRTQTGSFTDPVIGWQFDRHTYYAGDTVRAYLMLGTNTRPVKDCYGIGWRYSYEDKFAVPSSFRFSYSCDLFCNPSGELRMHKAFGESGEAVLVRTLHKGFTGDGELAAIQYILKDTGAANYDVNGEKIGIGIAFAQAADSTGRILGLHLKNDSATVFRKKPSGIQEIPGIDNQIRIYPNPASRMLTIETGSLQLQSLVLYNSLGEQVYLSGRISRNRLQIPVSDTTPGLYFIVIETQEGAVSRKIIIRH